MFIGLVLVISNSNEEYKVYYNKGNLKVSGTKLNGIDTGEWKYYNENGSLKKIEKKNEKTVIEKKLISTLMVQKQITLIYLERHFTLMLH